MLEFLKVSLLDADEFMAVKMNAFAEDIKTYGFGPSGYDDMEALKDSIKNNEFYRFKMVHDGKIVGGMSCKDQGNNEYWISGIYILKEYQNKGIGSKAIKFLEEEFWWVRVWRLDTPYKSYRNHHFYEKLGFVKIGETNPLEDRGGFYLFLYEKKMPMIALCKDDIGGKNMCK